MVRKLKYITNEDIKKALKGNKYQRDSARKAVALKKQGYRVTKGVRTFESIADFNEKRKKEMKKPNVDKPLLKKMSVRKFRTVTGKHVYIPVVK